MAIHKVFLPLPNNIHTLHRCLKHLKLSCASLLVCQDVYEANQNFVSNASSWCPQIPFISSMGLWRVPQFTVLVLLPAKSLTNPSSMKTDLVNRQCVFIHQYIRLMIMFIGVALKPCFISFRLPTNYECSDDMRVSC